MVGHPIFWCSFIRHSIKQPFPFFFFKSLSIWRQSRIVCFTLIVDDNMLITEASNKANASHVTGRKY
jgi:hypothetical protein